MKRFRPILTILIVLTAVLAVPASSTAGDFSIFGSYWESNDYEEAIGFGIRMAFFDDVQLEIGAAYYDNFGQDYDFDLDNPGFENIVLDVETIPVDVGVRFNFGGPLYLAGGGTLYLLDSPSGNVDDEFGFYGRVGAQFRTFFVEGGYRNVEGEIEDLDFEDLDDLETTTADLDLSGFFVNVGWRL